MLVGQATLETRLLLRNGEQLLLTIIIPTFLLAVLTTVPIVDIDSGRRIDFLTPGVLALAVMSTAFTGQAIATGYERRYGVLKWLGATPLPRWILLGGKIASVLLVEALQVNTRRRVPAADDGCAARATDDVSFVLDGGAHRGPQMRGLAGPARTLAACPHGQPSRCATS
jgi:hypothetical protein